MTEFQSKIEGNHVVSLCCMTWGGPNAGKAMNSITGVGVNIGVKTGKIVGLCHQEQVMRDMRSG